MTETFCKPLNLFLTGTIIVFICESAALFPLPVDTPLRAAAAIRLSQILLLGGFLYVTPGGLRSAGLSRSAAGYGIKIGFIWSSCFGALVFLAALVLFFLNIDFFSLVRCRLPRQNMALFFLTGAIVCPIAEEVYFRGLLYPFLRQYGVLSAVVISALVFACFHLQAQSLPVIQIIGGLIFAISFERSKSLLTPVIIHVLGNTALFSISLAGEGLRFLSLDTIFV
ncbi:MAG: type II CAAX endopeptidase family protein [Thermodesulfobacteriota bacterium]|nr:type II CAAX endopeptidase family protein [Thermodesulfobacteriota bacterium]